MRSADASKLRKPVGFAAAVTIAFASLFAGVPVSSADPYDDDGGGGDSSYDGGGDSGGGGGVEEPSGGVEEPGGGMEQPGGGLEQPGGGLEQPGGGLEQPGGGLEEPGGGMDHPGGGMHDDGPGEPGGGMGEPGGPGEPSGGGAGEPSAPGEPGGGMGEPGGPGEPPGGGAGEPGAEPSGGGMATPKTADAPTPDVKTASTTTTTETTTTTSTTEITSYQQSLTSSMSMSTLSTGLALSSPVTQWNSGWLSYDRYYRPIFTNPYRSPMQVIYDYGSQPQVFTVPPMQRSVINVPNSGVYSFTASTKPASGPPTNVSVGSFSGGGFQPAPGQAPPEKPAKLNTTNNALVQVKFDRGTSDPFRVKTLTDLGKDPSVNNTTRVLLDEEVPAWGDWSKTPQGDAVFVINQTQLLPGVSRPAQEPLPGYNVKLAAAQHSDSWISRHSTILIVVAVVAATLALVAVGLIVVTRRRRPTG